MYLNDRFEKNENLLSVTTSEGTKKIFKFQKKF
jgi:hypothetical protein